jgi:hypothetical protein
MRSTAILPVRLYTAGLEDIEITNRGKRTMMIHASRKEERE